MRLTANATVQPIPTTANTTYDAEGIMSLVWSSNQTTEKVNFQPLSGEIAFQEYGISDAKISNLVFMKKDTVAQEGGRIIYNSITYQVCGKDEFPNHCEVIVKPVVS